jgi:hypothetical protein
MICRDLIVSAISSHHVAIGIRPDGQLVRLLVDDARFPEKPKAFWVSSWKAITKARGRCSLPTFEKSIFLWDVPQVREEVTGCNSAVDLELNFRTYQKSVDWTKYLFHYTRSSRGPLLGESKEDYIRKLISKHPLASHEALDVLIHVAREGSLEASSGSPGKPVVRGRFKVVCWTAVPPKEISLFRRWNRSLARWTVEPYGIAVLKSLLKKLGAKPVCYLPEYAFDMLPEAERYRFQKHGPPRVNWKVEREWRIPFSVKIDRLGASEAFWFVPTYDDAIKFQRFSRSNLPVYVIQSDSFMMRRFVIP